MEDTDNNNQSDNVSHLHSDFLAIRHLQKLELTVTAVEDTDNNNQSDNASHPPLVTLLGKLRECKSLKSLTLNLLFCISNELKDEVYEIIVDWLTSPTCGLEELRLEAVHTPHHLFDNLNKCHSLCQLHVTPLEFETESDPFSTLLHSDSPLVKLHLNLLRSRINSKQVMQMFAQALCTNTVLQELVLVTSDVIADEEVLSSLASMLSCNNTLKTLSLKAETDVRSFEPVPLQAMYTLKQSLKANTKVEELCLSGLGFDKLLATILPQNQSLRSLCVTVG